jgi:serine/threonine-protein kinase
MGSSSDAGGRRIGPYRIVRVIGSGGMGIVYLAERADDSFRQQVAIKLVRSRLVDPETERRLMDERQILANLDHPNIARLFDGGATEDGTPYLVMEYIDGVPIDHYCDSRRLSLDERLHLFRGICSAVHYAHQNLVVHRDIKPTNILVTRDGTPKLLDFGIAKLLDAGGAASRELTREGMLMMTPENAAPEQVLEGTITTATDTYALGVLLYRLLSGHPPYRLGGSQRDVAEQICYRQPEPPSAMVGIRWQGQESHGRKFEHVAPEIVSRYRGTTTEKLRRRLKGDLDNIVLTALRKEPARRYRTVNELSEDIRLHQASLPVIARPDTWSYRSGKFLRRHVGGVAMSAVLIGLLIAFGVTMTVQTQRIAEERDTAMEVSRFLEEIFMAPDPGNARGLDVTAKEILARGADRISAELSARPSIQATLMATIGRVYFNLGEYQRAIEMLEEALRLRRAKFGEAHSAVAAVKNELGAVLVRTADYARARELLQEALAQHRRDQGKQGTAVAASLVSLAELSRLRGELDHAERVATESLAIYEGHGDRFASEIAAGKGSLARILRAKGDFVRAEGLYREAIAVIRQHLGEDHPLLAYNLHNLAVVLRARGDLDAAEAMFRESIDFTRNVLGQDHDLAAASLVMLGSLLHDKGQLGAAEAAFGDALALHRKAQGPEHPFVAYDMTSMAMLMFDKGQLEEAESLLRRALTIYENSVGPEHQYVASALAELAAVLTERGAPEEALPLVQRALEIRAADYPPTDEMIAATNVVYGRTLARLGRLEEAERVMLESVPRLLQNGVPPDRRARYALHWTAELYESWDRADEASRFRERLAAATAETD